jgi:GTP:adenosylcobinamide-phosphate guanylyltransferase
VIKQAVILCGGRGERLRPLTDTTPKPMIEVKGRPFVTYLITILEDVGMGDIVLSVGYLKEQFRQLEGRVRLSDAKLIVNDSVLAVSDLEDLFVLANGDCLPILRWRDFLNTDRPKVAVKDSFNRDAGICIMSKQLLPSVDCGNIRSLIPDERFDKFLAYGNLSIDTPEKLERTREFMSWWWKEKSHGNVA